MSGDSVRTTIRVRGGGLTVRRASENGGFDFSSILPNPTRSSPRYSLSLQTLGRLERLAKALFLLAEHRVKTPTTLDRSNAATVRSIALSVFASSEIEGQGYAVDEIEAFVAAHTEPGEHVNKELQDRLKGESDIFDTYFWAVNRKQIDPVIDYDFVLQIHKNMFCNTHPLIAGVVKDKEVRIRWQRGDGSVIDVPTVPASRAEEFLRALCARTSEMFRLASKNADAPMLLTAAEFACDFLAIHPFRDGNGRAARLLSTYLLEKAGYHFSHLYPLDRVVLDCQSDYYEALNGAQRYWHTEEEDLTGWVNFFVGAVFEQFERAFRRVTTKPSARPAAATPTRKR